MNTVKIRIGLKKMPSHAAIAPIFPQASSDNTISISELQGAELIIKIPKDIEWEGADHIQLYLNVGVSTFIGDYWVPEKDDEVISPEFTLPVSDLDISKTFIAWYTKNKGAESEKALVHLLA